MQKQNLPFRIFNPFPELLVAMSFREDGGMKFTTDSTGENTNNRKEFLEKLNLNTEDVVSAGLVHGNSVEIVSQEKRGFLIPATDGLITNKQGVFLSITVADCLPIILFHPASHTVVLLHAGWKGLDTNIIQTAIEKLKVSFLINPQELLVGIGPGIKECHYEVKEDLVDKFVEYSRAVTTKDKKSYVNLKLIALLQLERLGVMKENIEISDVCTFCQADIYLSFRKDKSIPVQAMMMVAGIR